MGGVAAPSATSVTIVVVIAFILYRIMIIQGVLKDVENWENFDVEEIKLKIEVALENSSISSMSDMGTSVMKSASGFTF